LLAATFEFTVLDGITTDANNTKMKMSMILVSHSMALPTEKKSKHLLPAMCLLFFLLYLKL
jgi:hypothetical protein